MAVDDDKTRASLLAQMRDDELNPEERKKTRLTNHIVERDMVDPQEIKKRTAQHDRLWFSLKWLPPLVENWKALGLVLAIAAFVGGEDLLNGVIAFVKGFMP